MAMAKAIGNHTGAPANTTNANPTASNSATSPPREGIERRKTKPMGPSVPHSGRYPAPFGARAAAHGWPHWRRQDGCAAEPIRPGRSAKPGFAAAQDGPERIETGFPYLRSAN